MNRGELRSVVLNRDRICVASLLDLTHDQCRDKWGDQHAPYDVVKLTLEHVKAGGGGERVDDPGRCIALCSMANVQLHWTSPPENNRLANAYLAGVAAGEGNPRTRSVYRP